jgi:hypothetical protein
MNDAAACLATLVQYTSCCFVTFVEKITTKGRHKDHAWTTASEAGARGFTRVNKS